MDVLIRYGFSIEEIKNMMDTNNSIEEINDKDIYELIDILEKLGCDFNSIKNIFICNPFYLSRNVNDINNLIKKLYEIGCSHLNILFDSNPYILNISDIDIDKLYNEKKEEGLNESEIVDYINYNIIY